MRALSVIEKFSAKGEPSETSPAVDVRARMLISILASMGTVIVGNLEGQLLLVVASLFYALAMRRPMALVWAYGFTAFMGLMALGCTWLMGLWLPTLMGGVGAASLVMPFLRLMTMVHVVLPLALGCRMTTILDALRNMHLPLCLYLPAAVVIRFIPAFVHDVRQVSESLRLRGYEPGIGSTLRHPLLTLRLFCAPLLFRCLRASEDLGIAAELKGLGGGERMIPYRCTSWSGRDSLLVLTATGVLGGALLCQYLLGTSITGGMR